MARHLSVLGMSKDSDIRVPMRAFAADPGLCDSKHSASSNPWKNENAAAVRRPPEAEFSMPMLSLNLFVVHVDERARARLAETIQTALPQARIEEFPIWQSMATAKARPGFVVIRPERPVTEYAPLIEQAAREGCTAGRLFLVRRDRSQDVMPLIRAGADAIVVEGAHSAEFSAAYMSFRSGGLYLSKCFAIALGRELEPPSTRGSAYGLTEREREILSLVCVGLSSKEIARRLSLSVRTIDAHRLNIRKKTNASDRRSLIFAAQAMGLFGNAGTDYPIIDPLASGRFQDK